jgi:LmbE family N-acetylglucosaminyl deacetylase
MKIATKFLLSKLSKAARPFLRSQGLMRVKKIFNASALEWQPGNERVLVLAPHMDDETIGCGGTLARHIACGAQVTVMFLTDGRLGGGVETRRQEAQRALQELGVQEIRFGSAMDGNLAVDKQAAEMLRALLAETAPQIVYLPYFLEEHPDHRAASAVLAQAVSSLQISFLCYGYEVWTPLFPNCLVRIDATIEAKRRALGHYQSQLAEADYLHTALGLNAYRSSALLAGDCRFAEAFAVLPLKAYLEAFRDFERTTAPHTVVP